MFDGYIGGVMFCSISVPLTPHDWLLQKREGLHPWHDGVTLCISLPHVTEERSGLATPNAVLVAPLPKHSRDKGAGCPPKGKRNHMALPIWG